MPTVSDVIEENFLARLREGDLPDELVEQVQVLLGRDALPSAQELSASYADAGGAAE